MTTIIDSKEKKSTPTENGVTKSNKEDCDSSNDASSNTSVDSDSGDDSVQLSVSDDNSDCRRLSLAQQQKCEIASLKRERVDLLRRLKRLLEQLERGEQEKLEMLAFCRESNDKSAACLREVAKLKHELDKQKRRVRAALADRRPCVCAATQTQAITGADEDADRSLQCQLLGGSVASAADSGRGDTNSAHSAQSEDSPDRRRRLGGTDIGYYGDALESPIVAAASAVSPEAPLPTSMNSADVSFGRQKLLRTSTRMKKSSGGSRQDQLAREAVSLPLTRWRAEHVAAWAASPGVGLAAYAERLQATVKSGDILARLTDADMQRELSISEPLHRRRLRLAIDRLRTSVDSPPQPPPSLDAAWVADQLLPSLGLRHLSSQFHSELVDCGLLLTLDKSDLKGNCLAIRHRRHRRSLMYGIALLRYVRLDWARLLDIRQKFASHLLLYWSAQCLYSWLLLWGAPISEDNLLESGLHGAYLVWSSDWERPVSELLKGAHCRKYVLMELARLVKESQEHCDRPPLPGPADAAAAVADGAEAVGYRDRMPSTDGSTVSSSTDLTSSAAASTAGGSQQQQIKYIPSPPSHHQSASVSGKSTQASQPVGSQVVVGGGGEFRRVYRQVSSSVSSSQQPQQQQPRLSLRGGRGGPPAAGNKLPYKNTMI